MCVSRCLGGVSRRSGIFPGGEAEKKKKKRQKRKKKKMEIEIENGYVIFAYVICCDAAFT